MENVLDKIVFFGTSEFSVSSLESLKEGGLVPSLIITAPDRPVGRKQIITPPPVKVWALKNGIPVLQPEKLDGDFIASLKTNHCQLAIVAAYGKILPKEIVEMPKYGALNIHPSKLPEWRGASPLQYTILNDNEAWVSIIKMDNEMDHGPVLAQEKLKINKWPVKTSELGEIAFRKGGEILTNKLSEIVSGNAQLIEQDHEVATYTKKIKKEDGLIDLNGSSEINYRKYCAFDVWPKTHFLTPENKRVVITDADFTDGKFKVKNVIPEGRKEMSYNDFIK